MDDIVLELVGHLKHNLATEPSPEGEMYREAKRSIERAGDGQRGQLRLALEDIARGNIDVTDAMLTSLVARP